MSALLRAVHKDRGSLLSRESRNFRFNLYQVAVLHRSEHILSTLISSELVKSRGRYRNSAKSGKNLMRRGSNRIVKKQWFTVSLFQGIISFGE